MPPLFMLFGAVAGLHFAAVAWCDKAVPSGLERFLGGVIPATLSVVCLGGLVGTWLTR